MRTSRKYIDMVRWRPFTVDTLIEAVIYAHSLKSIEAVIYAHSHYTKRSFWVLKLVSLGMIWPRPYFCSQSTHLKINRWPVHFDLSPCISVALWKNSLFTPGAFVLFTLLRCARLNFCYIHDWLNLSTVFE